MSRISIDKITRTYNNTESSEEKTPEVRHQTRSKRLFREFLETTTAHGFAHISGDNVSTWRRLTWIVVLVVVYFILTYVVANVVINYLAYPSSESSTVKPEVQPFPDVSLCSLDPISTRDFETLRADPTSELHWYSAVLDQLDVVSATGTFDMPPSLLDAMLDRYKSSYGYQENLPQREIDIISHKKKDFLLSCTFGMHGSCLENFEEVFIPGFLRCFTLRMNGTDSRGTGPVNGLSLILYIENFSPGQHNQRAEYNAFSVMTQARGSRVTIHPTGTRPSVGTHGLDVMPGHTTSVSLSSQRISRLPHPWGNCTTNRTLKEDTTYKYSSHACTELCKQRTVVKMCACAFSYLPVIGEYLLSLPLCGAVTRSSNVSRALEELECAITTLASLQGACACPPPCDDYIYTATMSEASWPGPKFLSSFYETFVLENPDAAGSAPYRDLDAEYRKGFPDPIHAQNSFARLNIYFKSDEVVERVQTPTYTTSSLFSDLGGTLGLWAGISVLTIIEFVQFLFRVTHAILKNRK